jgi:hypothetical protein
MIILISLIIALILILILFYIKIDNFNNIDFNKYFIVCARYNKDVSFLNKIPINNSVLQKGNKEGEIVNIANEATSYLYYIINNYDKLADNVIFIHDEDENWHHDGKISDNIYKWIKYYEDNKLEYYNFNNYTVNFTDLNLDKNIIKINNEEPYPEKVVSAFNKYYETILIPYKKIMVNKQIKCAAQFIISKQRIRKNSKEFYEKIYNWLITNTNGEGNGDMNDPYSGYWTGRFLEITWDYIFN